MQHADILALAGLRIDGRRSDEVRQLRCKLGLQGKCEGSVMLSHGLNKVLCTVNGPVEGGFRDAASSDKGTIVCQIAIASFAGTERKKKRSQADRRTQEMQNIIQNIFSADGVVELDSYPKSEIRINIHVFEDDGSLLCTMINAASMALMDAGIFMKDFVVACSAGKFILILLLILCFTFTSIYSSKCSVINRLLNG
jgi:exosome complex component RRP41